MSFRSVMLAAVVLLGFSAGPCCAQFGNTGGGATGGVTITQAGGGATGLTGNTGGGLTGGGGAGGGTQFGTTNLNAADGTLSQTVGQNAFVGQGQTGFVGNRQAGTSNAAAQSQPQFGALNRNTTRPTQQQTNTQKRQVRPQFRIGFAMPARPPLQTQNLLAQRVVNLSNTRNIAPGVSVQIDEAGTVTLTGTATSADQARLMEAYVRLEPGVRNVNNLVIVSE